MATETARAGARRNHVRRGAAAGAALLALWAKLRALLLLVLKFKLFVSLVSFAAFAFTYGAAFGWTFGLGLALLLAIHEGGHLWEIRRQGLAAGLPVFVPFLGAAIGLRQRPVSAWHEFRVAAAGPAAGFLASALCLTLSRALGNGLFTGLAYFGFLLQLFNLIPVSPLDGGRMIAAVERRLWWFGLAVLAAAVVWLHSPFTLLIGVLVLVQLLGRVRRVEDQAYYDLARWQKATAFAVWLALVALCAVGLWAAEGALAPA